MDESKNAAGMSAEDAELHQQGVRIAKSYFRYRGAEILSAEADNADAPDICCTVDEGTVLADVVAVTNIDEEEEVSMKKRRCQNFRSRKTTSGAAAGGHSFGWLSTVCLQCATT